MLSCDKIVPPNIVSEDEGGTPTGQRLPQLAGLRRRKTRGRRPYGFLWQKGDESRLPRLYYIYPDRGKI